MWSAVVHDLPTLSHRESELVGVEAGVTGIGSVDPRGPWTARADSRTQRGADSGPQRRPRRLERRTGQIIHNSLTSQNRCSVRALGGLGT